MQTRTSEVLISCENVSFAYDGITVAENIDFNISSGDYLCIVGENGAGKSTLMKGLLGLKQPSSGKIITGGGLKSSEIGYLPQQTAIQRDFPASVFEVVISGCLNKCKFPYFYTKKHKKIAKDNMKNLGISELEERCYRELSGGQQQRVLLARALCATEKMLLLDEPVTGLDPSVTSDMYRLIASINKKFGITIIMISHDIKNAAEYASHILHVNKKQLFFGRSADYLLSNISDRFINNDNTVET